MSGVVIEHRYRTSGALPAFCSLVGDDARRVTDIAHASDCGVARVVVRLVSGDREARDYDVLTTAGHHTADDYELRLKQRARR